MASEAIEPSGHKDILVTHEQEYWQSQVHDCQGIVLQIMKEIAVQSKVTLTKSTMKGLDKVSQPVQIYTPEVSFIWTQKIHT